MDDKKKADLRLGIYAILGLSGITTWACLTWGPAGGALAIGIFFTLMTYAAL